MRETRCEVCGSIFSRASLPREAGSTGFRVTFSDSCVKCEEVIIKAFSAITYALKQGHEEQRERVLNSLIDSLDRNGFQMVEPFPAVLQLTRRPG